MAHAVTSFVDSNGGLAVGAPRSPRVGVLGALALWLCRGRAAVVEEGTAR
jgi:hypothetical protein